MPSSRDYVVNELLAEVAIGYKNEAYVARTFMPQLTVKKKTGIYYKFDRASMRYINGRYAAGTRANKIDQGLTQIEYGPLEKHGFEADVEDETIEEIGDQDAKNDAAELIAEQLMVEQEVEFFALLTTLTEKVTLSSTSQWDHADNADLFARIRAGHTNVLLKSGKRANKMLVSFPVHQVLAEHPDVLSRISAIKTFASTEDLAKLFEVEEYVISTAAVNGGKEGQSDSQSFIAGKHAWLFYVAPEAGKKRKYLTFGHTLTLASDSPETEFSEHPQPLEEKTIIKGKMRSKQHVMAQECAYWFENAIS